MRCYVPADNRQSPSTPDQVAQAQKAELKVNAVVEQPEEIKGGDAGTGDAVMVDAKQE